MRITRIITLAAVAAMLASLPSQVRADEAEDKRTVTKSYVAGDVSPWDGAGWRWTRVAGNPHTATSASFCGDMVVGPNVGAVCFGEILGDVITLKIEDDSGLPVGGLAEFYGGNGSYRQIFCGESSPFPNNGGDLHVYLSTPSNIFYTGCPLSSLPTKGRVHATFTTRGP